VAGFQKKELSVIGDACEMGDKVTVKQCAVGKGCTIGAKSKLNNCVIMDNVTIGER
jgi:translation initiation factor eIF-2B subunit gamma